MVIRKAAQEDIDAVERLYDAIHTAEENGERTIGWIRGVYPVRVTAENALKRDDLFGRRRRDLWDRHYQSDAGGGL